MQQFEIFIVEDDVWYAELLEYSLLDNPAYKISKFYTGQDCISNLGRKPDLITLDYSLPDITGEKVLAAIREHDPSIPVIIISGQDIVATAIELLKSGATDYIVKDDNTARLLKNSVHRIKEHSDLKKQVTELKNQLSRKYDLDAGIVSNSPAMAAAKNLITKATTSNINVVVYGEKGVGKDFVARVIHHNSARKNGPFVVVHPYERELFTSNIESGDTTSSSITFWKQKLTAAAGGSIYLNNIDLLPATDQQLICDLWMLSGYNEVSAYTSQSIRIISSTIADVPKKALIGHFNKHLFQIISGIQISLPALHARKQDILPLARQIVNEYCLIDDRPVVSFSKEAEAFLQAYHYPGNVTELRTVLHLAVTICERNCINVSDISFNGILTHHDDGDNKAVRQLEQDIVVYYMKKYKNVAKVSEKLKMLPEEINNIMNAVNRE